MSIAALKLMARRTVHATFGEPSFYRATLLGAEVEIPAGARLHTKQEIVGDLDREGFPTAFEMTDRIIITDEDRLALGIQENGYIRTGDGRLWRLAVRRPARDTFSSTFEVLEQKAP